MGCQPFRHEKTGTKAGLSREMLEKIVQVSDLLFHDKLRISMRAPESEDPDAFNIIWNRPKSQGARPPSPPQAENWHPPSFARFAFCRTTRSENRCADLRPWSRLQRGWSPLPIFRLSPSLPLILLVRGSRSRAPAPYGTEGRFAEKGETHVRHC